MLYAYSEILIVTMVRLQTILKEKEADAVKSIANRDLATVSRTIRKAICRYIENDEDIEN